MKENKHPIARVFILILLFIFSVLLYSRFISTSGLKVKEYKIVNSNITDNYHGLKIIHLSDIHYGSIIDSNRLEEIVEKINYINPDVVVITGDLIDKDYILKDEDIKNIINSLSKIKVSLGKYAIRGNHDYYFEDWDMIINNSNFINLDNSYELIYKDGYEPLLISGLSSMQDETDFETRYNALRKSIKNNNINTIFNILLIHEPDLINSINTDDYDLVLAGHSHNGQVRLPVIGALIKADGAKKYYDEYYRVNNTDLYISSGLGTSGLDFRFFNKPSFNFYRITNK